MDDNSEQKNMAGSPIARIPWHLEYSLERYLWRRKGGLQLAEVPSFHLEYSLERSLGQRLLM